MQIRRALELLILGLSAASVADATFVNPRLVRNGKAIQRRQETDDGGSAGAATTPSSPVETTPTAPTPSSSSAPPPNTPPADSSSSSKTTPTSSSSTPPANTGGNNPPQQTSSSSTSPSRTTPGQPAQTTAPPSQTEKQEPITMVITEVITKTNADGSKSTITSEILTTSTPGLAGDGKKSNSGSGLSTQSRNTIIGVVVGVGGAIILGGLAFVAFRIWGRKKQQEENDGLMDYGSTGTAEKADTVGSQSGRTPFQSTLESYHAPGQVNQAANF